MDRDEPTREERATAWATRIAAGIADDASAFSALTVASEPAYSQRRNGAYVVVGEKIKLKLGILFTDSIRPNDLISSIHCALEHAVTKPGATPDTVRTDAVAEIADALLPIIEKSEREREELMHLLSTDWVGMNSAF